MCTVLLPPGVNPIAVKYMYIVSSYSLYIEAPLRVDRKGARPEIWYLLPARNECDEVEVVDMLVLLCRSCVRISTCHVTWRHLTSGFNTVVYRHVVFTSVQCGLRDLRILNFRSFCGAIYMKMYLKNNTNSLDELKTSKTLSWMFRPKLSIRLLVIWGRDLIPAFLSTMDIFSTYCETESVISIVE
jgi:hypothetical protein